ncbi:MAG: nickel transport protein [Desulfobacteraceae bacterium Eth-SRB1]|nr:MAG: nickel transport protein [Desulfobacteraceae bacterium Eth-SRB1]
MFKKKHNRKIFPLLYLFLFILLTTFSVTPAFAHKVTIFAWVEGDTIYTQSKFSGGKKAKGSLVTVFDTEGNRLLGGKTDEKGEYSFKIPKKTGLKIVLKASMGHMAEWKIPVEEIVAVQASQNKTPEAGVISNTASPSNLAPISDSTSLQREEIRRLIDESLDKKLSPIISMLAKLQDQDPGISEVMGGIGYIFGLVGVALYFTNRRKKL